MTEKIVSINIGDIQIDKRYIANPLSNNLNYYMAKRIVYVPVRTYTDEKANNSTVVVCERYYDNVLDKGQPLNPEAAIHSHLPASLFLNADYILER